MPGPALHHMIASRLSRRIQSGNGLGGQVSPGEYAQLQALLADPKNMPYLFLGCQGPDFFFFNLKDIAPDLHKVVDAFFEVYDFIEGFQKKIREAIEPVRDAVDRYIAGSALLTEVKQTFDDLRLVMDAFMAVLLEAVKRFVSEFNIFDALSHPYRDGAKEEKWWWFDAMHYRKTGKYAKALLDAAPDPGSPNHLYALGYLTHVAADTVGHPYVNIVSGGPYRSHAQRHKASENYQDVFNFLGELGSDLNRSKLHALYNFNFNGTVSDTKPDPATRMPEDLAEMIAKALNSVFQKDADVAPEYGKTVSAADVDNTYRLWYKWFRNATDTGTLPKPEPYEFTKELQEVWDAAMADMADIGDFLDDAADMASKGGFLAIFIMLAALIIAALMAVAAIAEAIAAGIVTLSTATIRAASRLIYELLYDAYQKFRLGVAMNGLAFPMTEHLGDPRIRHFANPAFQDLNHNTASSFPGLVPQLKFDIPAAVNPFAPFFHLDRHLVYPPPLRDVVDSGPPPVLKRIPSLEKPQVPGAPGHYFNKFSTWYAWGDFPISPTVLDQLAPLAANSDPRQNDDGTLLQAIVQQHSLGNALDLSRLMYDHWKGGGALPDFNLDADRGYGHLCWVQENLDTGSLDDPHEPKEIVVKTQPEKTVGIRFVQ